MFDIIEGISPFMIYDIQKASMWKRISAYLFDLILLAIAAVGVASLLSVLLNYDGNLAKYEELKVKYEQEYSVDFDISQEDYDKLTKQEVEIYNTAYKAFVLDENVRGTELLLINLTLVMISFSVLIAYVLLELLVPMIFRNGQTLGKKIFGLAVVRIDGVKINTFQLFVRTVLGKCTIETLLPILLFLVLIFNLMPLAGLLGLIILPIIQIVCIAATKYRHPMHELLSGTVTVDFSSQLIFENTEQLLEYKKKLHEQEVKNAEY